MRKSYLIVASLFMGLAHAADGIDSRFDSIVSAISENRFRPASIQLMSIERSIRDDAKVELTFEQRKASLMANTSRQETMAAIESARTAYKRGDWMATLLALAIAEKGTAQMFHDQTPGVRLAQDSAEAATSEISIAQHVAAVSAYQAGDWKSAIKFANRELELVNEKIPSGARAPDHQRAYTILGMAQLASGDIKSANDSLLHSIHPGDSSKLGPLVPNMALAAELLARNQRQAVSDFLQQLSVISSNPLIAQWKRTLDSGLTPDFGFAAHLN